VKKETAIHSVGEKEQSQGPSVVAEKQNNDSSGTYLVCNDELFWKELKVMAEDSLQNNK
jgi:hypothetical protein